MTSSCRVTLSVGHMQTNPFLFLAKLGTVAFAIWHVSLSSSSRERRVSIHPYVLHPIRFTIFSQDTRLHAEAGFVYSGGCGGLECKSAVIALDQEWTLGMQE